MHKYCTICKRKIEKATSVFKPPRSAERRQLWENACGRILKDNQLICQRHFSPQQYCEYSSTLKRLILNAVPHQELYSYDSDSNADEEAEDNSIATSFELINEEDFDAGTNTATENDDGCSGGGSDGEEIDVAEELQQSFNSTSSYRMPSKCSIHSKSAQTGCAATLSCGLIEVTKDYKIYTMKCFHCDEIFPIWSWTKFVKHIQEKHRHQEQRTVCNENDNVDEIVYSTETECTKTYLYKVQPPTKEYEMKIENVKIELEIVQKDIANKNEEEMDDSLSKAAPVVKERPQKKPKKRKNEKKDEPDAEDLQLADDEEIPDIVKVEVCSASEEDNDDDEENYGEAVNQRSTDGNQCFTSDGDGDVDNYGEGVNQRQRDANQIYLRDKPVIVKGLLALWRTYPALWHNRPGHQDAAYDGMVAELTAKFNSKWNLSKTNRGIYQSLYRLRKWFYSFKRGMPLYDKTKMAKYYDQCAEFLPDRTALPLSCPKCIFFFADEQQLQAHYDKRHETFCSICRKQFTIPTKYRYHAVIHAPPAFTCPTCGKKYHRPAGLHEHMRAHSDERNFVCDKCGKKFVRSKTLRDHTVQVHSKDLHKCIVCDERFKTWNSLIAHKRREHTVLEGTIEDLEKQRRESRQKKDRKVKYMTVFDPETGTDRIVCDVCGNTYRFANAMLRHKVRAHGYVKPVLRRTHTKKKSFFTVVTKKQSKPKVSNQDKKATMQRKALMAMECDDDEEEQRLFDDDIIEYDIEENPPNE